MATGSPSLGDCRRAAPTLVGGGVGCTGRLDQVNFEYDNVADEDIPVSLFPYIGLWLRSKGACKLWPGLLSPRHCGAHGGCQIHRASAGAGICLHSFCLGN